MLARWKYGAQIECLQWSWWTSDSGLVQITVQTAAAFPQPSPACAAVKMSHYNRMSRCSRMSYCSRMSHCNSMSYCSRMFHHNGCPIVIGCPTVTGAPTVTGCPSGPEYPTGTWGPTVTGCPVTGFPTVTGCQVNRMSHWNMSHCNWMSCCNWMSVSGCLAVTGYPTVTGCLAVAGCLTVTAVWLKRTALFPQVAPTITWCWWTSDLRSWMVPVPRRSWKRSASLSTRTPARATSRHWSPVDCDWAPLHSLHATWKRPIWWKWWSFSMKVGAFVFLSFSPEFTNADFWILISWMLIRECEMVSGMHAHTGCRSARSHLTAARYIKLQAGNSWREKKTFWKSLQVHSCQ